MTDEVMMVISCGLTEQQEQGVVLCGGLFVTMIVGCGLVEQQELGVVLCGGLVVRHDTQLLSWL